MSETVKVGRWNVPKKLLDDYVRFTIMANTYLDPKAEAPSHSSYERRMRWSLSVEQVMRVHREICQAVGVAYSMEHDDEFYSAFFREVEKQTRMKG